MTHTTTEDGAPRPLSLRANFLALTAGRVMAALAQWGGLIVVAKVSDVATVGQFALAQVICVPTAEIARMGLREVRATDVERDYAFRDYFGLRILLAAAAFLVMIVIGAVAADSTSVFLVIVIYAGSRVVELLSDIVYGLFQLQERLDFIGRSLALVAPLSIMALTVGFLATDSLIGAVTGQLLAYLLVFLAHDLPTARTRIVYEVDDAVQPAFRPEVLTPLFRLTVPLALSALLAIVAIELPRVLVAAELGTDALGIFAPLFVLAMAPSRFVHSLGTAATTRLATLHAAGDRHRFVVLLAKLAGAAAGFGLAGVLVAAVAAEQILGIVYTSEYEPYRDVFLVLVVAGTLRFEAVLLQYAVVAARRFWWLTASSAISAAVAVVAGLGLVGGGLEEAALAVAIVFGVQLGVVATFAVRALPPEARTAS